MENRQTTFATPLAQSPRSAVLEWRFPKPHNQLVLTGTSRAAWHTSFVIPQLNLLLDAGLCVNKLRPRHIFLTHGHSDHTLLAPAFIKRGDPDPPDVFAPAEMVGSLNDFLRAAMLLDLGGLVTADQALGADGQGLGSHLIRGMRSGDVVPLRRNAGWNATAFACDHSVPCVGYVFYQSTTRLRPEYAGLPGPEIGALRRSGVDVSILVSRPVFAFLGDTTAATLAAAPQWLVEETPVVITECSFLYEEHRELAEKTKHTLWSDLEKVVRQRPPTTFVLTHFSLRYSDDDVQQFFDKIENPPGNIVVWIDGR